MAAILRKELADYFNGIRCFILFLLVLLAAAEGLLAASQGIRGALGTQFVFLKLFAFSNSNVAWPPMISFLALFIPIIGIALGFDLVNSERSGGTLSRLLAQPVYRDDVINGKFIAALFMLTIMITTSVLLVAGYGLRLIGVPPTAEEIIRLFVYLVYSIVFGAFWMGMAILFSVVFRRIATSLLSSVSVWLFFYFFFPLLIVQSVSNSNTQLGLLISRLSPITLYDQAAAALLEPTLVRTLGLLTQTQIQYMVFNPLSLGQSLVLIWPYMTGLLALTLICFAISYLIFMRQEVRST